MGTFASSLRVGGYVAVKLKQGLSIASNFPSDHSFRMSPIFTNSEYVRNIMIIYHTWLNNDSYWLHCLTTEIEKYVNENKYIMNLAVLQHTIGDTASWRCNQRSLGSCVSSFVCRCNHCNNSSVCILLCETRTNNHFNICADFYCLINTHRKPLASPIGTEISRHSLWAQSSSIGTAH